ncbi:hypothetical protein, partial [Enterobacter asburiae]|uniref:hypothetical protein n=1 Tax=Enterobacter asburiae TaxID=61645 RepID=UPI002075842C
MDQAAELPLQATQFPSLSQTLPNHTAICSGVMMPEKTMQVMTLAVRLSLSALEPPEMYQQAITLLSSVRDALQVTHLM